jgi:hypothetical protein
MEPSDKIEYLKQVQYHYNRITPFDLEQKINTYITDNKEYTYLLSDTIKTMLKKLQKKIGGRTLKPRNPIKKTIKNTPSNKRNTKRNNQCHKTRKQ